MTKKTLKQKPIDFVDLQTGELVARPVFQTHYRRIKSSGDYEHVAGQISQTVPNQSLTINEIYKRYASGRPLTGVRNPIFDDDGSNPHGPLDFDDYMPDINHLDLAHRQEILDNAKQSLDEMKKKLNGIAAARQSEKDKETKALLKRIADLEKANPPAPSAGGDAK